MPQDGDEFAVVLAAVAEAVGLQEGSAGVRRVVRAIAALEPAPTRDVSRRAGLPVPLVAAVNNELRARGVVDSGRPARLTGYGRTLVDALHTPDPTCSCCAGATVVVPDVLRPVVERLDELVAAEPRADLTLDQSHSTGETKVRRVLHLLRVDALPVGAALFVGDDDLMSLAFAHVGEALGVRLVDRTVVLDVHRPLLEFLRAELGAAGTAYEHDLREPIPPDLRGAFDLAVTDPPYTVEGARLFLSRAVEGLRPHAGCDVLFSFGPKGPDDALAVQRAVVELDLATVCMYRNFNAYLGADIHGGRSTLHHLTTTRSTAPVVAGSYAGDLYTADKRGAARGYQCLACKERLVVGPGERWAMIEQLKQAGCPACGKRRFRPSSLVR
ncbi:MAG TPA: bis-aminopropyl spermidine synthase family protein [Pseudonocardiaceae bacterium]